ncbi:hypothetical protein [Embleya sp. AB8]|uniref:hypothetical protein n=1 Tax=Embleya sp. AB8 TaxID=3156304 RepID=UPI003C74747F
MRKSIKRMAVVGATGMAAVLATSTGAFAIGDRSAPVAPCPGYAQAANGNASGQVRQQGTDGCSVQLAQRAPSGETKWSPVYNTSGPGTTARTPWWSYGGGTCVLVIARDTTTGQTSNIIDFC